MKTRSAFGTLFLPLFLATGVPGLAQAAPPALEAPRELSIVVIESLGPRHGGISDFDRIDMVFTKVFEQRHWPVRVKVERFAANTPAHETELRVFFKGIREETPGDRVFRAWMTLTDHGTKDDFGIVYFRYYPRFLQNEEDVLEEVTRGAAEIAATKVGAILFPAANPPKP